MELHDGAGAQLRAIALLVLMASCLSVVANADDAKIVSDFESRFSNYLGMRKKDAGSTGRPTNSADKVSETQQNVASKAKALRPDANQGDIFTPEIATYFRRQISTLMTGAEGAKIRASLRRAEPVHGVALHVNQEYPEGIPLQSTPPSLLLKLPTLPDGLEYRIVGRNLVLRDAAPNLVVDFIPNALPAQE